MEEAAGFFCRPLATEDSMTSDPHTQDHPTGRERTPEWPGIDGAATQAARESPAEERERLLDEELDDTFPASDPPSWTMGGSVVSTLRH
jgi:hypothetical protein